jgi:parvulin-like peptidyl-prolyl isomerase
VGDVNRLAGFNEADLRYYVESFMYRERLEAAIGAEQQPATQEQVEARHILVADEAAARAALDRLNAGEPWDALANELSTDTSNKANGGYLGWFPNRGVMVDAFADAAFATTVGTISQPVPTQFGWHLIQVLNKEQRILPPDQLERARQQAFEDWLTEQRQATGADGQPVVTEFLEVWSTRVPTNPSLPVGQ